MGFFRKRCIKCGGRLEASERQDKVCMTCLMQGWKTMDDAVEPSPSISGTSVAGDARRDPSRPSAARGC